MEWTAVESSQIGEVGYDAETETLGIRFKPQGKYPASEYHYSNVGPLLHAELLSAESVGKFFGEHIKKHPELYPYRKVMPGIEGAIADFMNDHGIDTIKAGSTVIKREN